MAVFHAPAHGQVDPEAGAVERSLDVVGGQGVAGEQHVDVVGLDQRDHGRRGSGVYDAGPADPQHLLARGLGLTHAAGNLAYQQRLRLLARDLGLHEAEGLRAPVTHHRLDLDAVGAGHDVHAGPDVGHRKGVDAGPVVGLLDDETTVHLGVLDLDPSAAESDPGHQIRRRVEPVGKDPVLLADHHSGRPGVDLVDSAGLQAHQEALEGILVLSGHGDRGVGGVGGVMADVETVDGVVAAVLPDVVEDPAQDAGVHQMAGDLHGLALAHASDSSARVSTGSTGGGYRRAPLSQGSSRSLGICQTR